MRDVSTWDGIKSPCVPFSMRVKVKLQPPPPLFTTTHRATFVKHYGHNKDDLLSNIYCCPYFSKARTSRSLNRQLECISNIHFQSRINRIYSYSGIRSSEAESCQIWGPCACAVCPFAIRNANSANKEEEDEACNQQPLINGLGTGCLSQG